MKIRGSSSESTPNPKISASEFLAEAGIQDANPQFDDRIHRHVHTCGPGDVAWAVFHSEPFPRGSWGCWRCRKGATWVGIDRELTAEDKAAIKKADKERKSLAEEKQKHLADSLTNKLFPGLKDAPPDHPYLVAKGIPPKGFKIHPQGFLVVPLQDEDGIIWSIQGISHEAIWGPLDENGKHTLSKSFEKGGRVRGCFFPIGEFKEAPNIVVCEGAATAATIHAITGLPVAAAASASNLTAAARAIRSKWPKALITIAGDNDRHTMEKDGTNPGLEESEAAHLQIHGSSWVYPDFGDLPARKDLSDFNDLARERGEQSVLAVFAAQIPPPKMALVFNGANSSWWSLDESGLYLPVAEGIIRQRLHIHGLKRYGEKSQPSAVDREVDRIIHQEAVHYAGPLAGWPAGIHQMMEKRILVSEPCRLPVGVMGDCSTLNQIILDCLGPKQHWWMMNWIKLHRRRIRYQSLHPMPACALIGEAQSGKSFLQSAITKSLGGRSAKPAAFLQGKSEFNGNLFGAEHLMFEDESADASSEARRNLGEKIKELLFCRTVNCRAMYQPSISLMPYWALSLSLNNAIEHIMILPVIDDSLMDKISILAVSRVKRPVPDGMNETEWLGELLTRELPGLLFAIDNDLEEIHPKHADDRTKLAAIQDPGIMAQLNELSNEERFFSLVDDVLFAGDGLHLAWEGTQEQLSRKLRDSESRGYEASRLLSWPVACGSYLGKLIKRYPFRISTARVRDGTVRERRWKIEPPAEF